MTVTNITDDHRRAFHLLTSGDYDNFALFSCFIDGSPAAAIVALSECPTNGIVRVNRLERGRGVP